MKDKDLKYKIGFCRNKYLKGLENISGGHYVYINSVNKNGTCNVNVITSLETSKENYSVNKLKQVRKGNTYAIPCYEANFKKWSGITKNSINNVEINKIVNIGNHKISDKQIKIFSKFYK